MMFSAINNITCIIIILAISYYSCIIIIIYAHHKIYIWHDTIYTFKAHINLLVNYLIMYT